MQARRILLILAVALLVTAVGASLVPQPGVEDSAPEDEQAAEQGRPAEGEPAGADATTIVFDARRPPKTARLPADRHVVVTVRANAPGQVEIEDLGRVEQVDPLAPATFDLFTDRNGAFDLVYQPVEGPPRRLGTIVVNEGTKPERPRARAQPIEQPSRGSEG